VTVYEALRCFASVAIVAHVTTPEASTPPPLAETNVALVGSVSVTTTLAASTDRGW